MRWVLRRLTQGASGNNGAGGLAHEALGMPMFDLVDFGDAILNCCLSPCARKSAITKHFMAVYQSNTPGFADL